MYIQINNTSIVFVFEGLSRIIKSGTPGISGGVREQFVIYRVCLLRDVSSFMVSDFAQGLQDLLRRHGPASEPDSAGVMDGNAYRRGSAVTGDL